MHIGILGAGQLSRMLALAGIPLGCQFSFYDPKATACVTGLGESFQGDYTDFNALDRFLEKPQVITYENENIPLETLQYLLKKGMDVHPSMGAIEVMQDRLLEKNFLTQLGIPTAEYRPVNNKDELMHIVEAFSFPAIIKRRTQGYDGKGQVLLKCMEDVNSVDEDQLTNGIVEQFVNFDREISLVGCRDKQGHYAFYDVCENVHNNGILYKTINVQNDPMHQEAKTYLTRIMDTLEYVGVCTAEFFVSGDRLIANELAPRVHNTGHWTIEGAVISQFENHLRCIAGYPLGDASSVGDFSMYNILGAFPKREALLSHHSIHVHDYQKAPKANRKIGHISFAKNEAVDAAVVDLLSGE